MPAPMPAATAMRRSWASRWSQSPISEAKPAEICAAGPSRPPEPPEPMVMAEATSLIGGMRARMRPHLWWIASMAASVPWPSASGASEKTMRPEIRPPSAVTTGSSHGRAMGTIVGEPSPSGAGGR